jgi:DtxR family transcriptional regulator, Mn-dependent transcriptional regulator
VISDDVEARLVVLLGNPTTCPHGNPIPGAQRVTDTEPDGRVQRSLAEAQPGDRIRLERVTESIEHDSASLSYLGDHGLTPGTTATIRARAPDGTITLAVGDATVALGPAICERMFVAAV